MDDSPVPSLFASLRRQVDEFGKPLTGGGAAGARLALFAGAAAWTVYALHWPLLGVVVPWDAKDFYYPVLRALAAARAAGETGFWNPYLYAGHAAVADPQSWLFTPGFRLLAELHPAPGMMLVDAVQLLHLLFGGFGVLLLIRRLGFVPAAGLLAALVFMFGGVAASRLQHSLMTVSYAYLPWALWLLHRALHDAQPRSRLIASCGFGAIAGLMALDRDQTAFLNCWLLIGAAAWWLVFHTRAEGFPAAARRAFGLLPGAAVAVAILALPMLLTLDALAGSTRPEIGFAIAGYASQQPASLLTLLAPNLFGTLDPAGAYWGPGRLPWMALSALGNDWTDETTNYLYIGAVPLALLLCAAARRGVWPTGSGWIAVGLAFALFYALGAYTPVFRLFYDWLPGVSLYRRPNDAGFAVNAMLALLVACAVQKLLTDAAWSRRRIAVLLCLGVTLVAAALWLGARFDRLPAAGFALAGALTVFALALVAVVYWRRHRSGSASLALIVFAAADLIGHNAAAPFNGHPIETVTAYRPAGEILAEEMKARLADPAGPYRAEIFGIDGSWQNAAMVYGIEQTLGYNPLRRADYAEATGAFQNNHGEERRLTGLFAGYDSPLARLLGIKLVVAGQAIETILPENAHRSLRFVGRHEGAYLYENAAALPRVMVAARAEPDVGQALSDDPQARALILGLSEAHGDATQGPAGRARILSRSRDELRVEAAMVRPGFLLVNELHHPGWIATQNGREIPVLRANRLFRAVALPAGAHDVTFRFRPFGRAALRTAVETLLTK